VANASERQHGEHAASQQAMVEAVLSEKGQSLDPSNVPAPLPGVPETTRQLSDLAAGAIGSVASYLADQLGELFAPTPPEVREAQAKAEAKRDAEKPAEPDPYDKIIGAAVRSIQEDRAAGQDETYWKERDRGKGWERDQ
jgi:hypothetical protein